MKKACTNLKGGDKLKEFFRRLKSPVVLVQIVSIIASLIVTIYPEFNGVVDKIVYSLTVIINCIAGLNNPTDREHF